ncbi:heterokaryon incompatibility protein [Beauveria brongniartii RCEF 3172]|uniref:Heterokaryon incompatibility protein n=1 Tax=Beauveria brongniartii RCEF 3172 TaxID=1081107 RepID=A0A166XMU7_9HYPO|nr:heterokaryon incompatibility protein [Beauveria brongniartii RCEF 3172]
MQDDDQEKLAEIMQMDEVYFNAVLNISAVEGQSSEGLEFARELPRTNPCRSIVQVPGSQERVDLQVFPERWFLRRGEAPLNNRGWVFQERTLSPRIVQFAKDQAFWECRSLLASEVLPQGLPCATALRSNKGVGIGRDSSDILQVKSRWYALVEEYSRTLVTFPDDHLLAVSAVAKRFCHAMLLDPSDYVAGMWKDDLPLSMLWGQEPLPGRAGPEPTSIGREMKHAPSWSWASVFAPIVMLDFDCPLVASTEVLGVELARKSPNFFDGTESCRIRLRGPLAKLCRRLRDGEAWVQIGHDAEFQEFDEFEFQKGSSIIIWWDTARKMASNEFFSLHIGSEPSADGRIERGVILCRTMDRGIFSRVGSFMIPLGSESAALDVVQIFTSCSHLLSEDDFLEHRLSGKCVIDVI